ncbi:MAG: hypothetical protein GF409_05950 [Candidatus Omnitrophica bacterium]|nr:hypothetical protein [Candidatus Omnitrophota bacterium]
MNIRNMDKLPEGARKALEPFLQEVIEAYGNDLVSIFAYGSVTGPDYNPKTSDINVAVVLKDVTLPRLKELLKPVQKASRKGITAPLFLSPEYIRMSLDTFPIEFWTMKDSRCVLFGEDVLEGIEVEKEDLRRECEYQLKGKLLMIRQAYLEQALNRKGAEKIIKASFRSLMPVFRSMIRLKSGQSPREKAEVLSQMGEEFGVDPASFLEVLRDKKTASPIGRGEAEPLIKGFIDQLERLSSIADNF